MASLNKAIIIGHLGKDPEVKYMPNGEAVVNFSVATTETWKDKQSGEKKERTEWHNITAYGRLAEICGEYLRKGIQVYLEGKLQTRKWQDKQTGQDRYSTEIVLGEMKIMGSKNSNQGAYSGQDQESSQQSSAQSRQSQSKPSNDFDDDIPF